MGSERFLDERHTRLAAETDMETTSKRRILSVIVFATTISLQGQSNALIGEWLVELVAVNMGPIRIMADEIESDDLLGVITAVEFIDHSILRLTYGDGRTEGGIYNIRPGGKETYHPEVFGHYRHWLEIRTMSIPLDSMLNWGLYQRSKEYPIFMALGVPTSFFHPVVGAMNRTVEGVFEFKRKDGVHVFLEEAFPQAEE